MSSKKTTAQKKHIRWVITVFVSTIFISAFFSLLSSLIFDVSGLLISFLVLLLIVLVGILFDIVGVAVTAADEAPFHAMASRRMPEARDAIRLLRNAARVGSVCNDVIGDICGVISGAASAAITSKLILTAGLTAQKTLFSVLLSALVAAATVGGKAAGKSIAIKNSTAIVRITAKIIYTIKMLPSRIFCRGKR